MIIDAHVHLPSPQWSKHSDYFADEDRAVRYLQGAGISAAIFNTWQGVGAETENDIEEANAAALALYQRYQGFLYPGAVIHPSFPETSRKWLDQFRQRGLMWVGELVPTCGKCEFNEPPWMCLLEYCAEHGHAVQLHSDASIIDVADAFPDMRIVCSHINFELSEKLSGRANIWLDMSGYVGGLALGALEKALALMGGDRILFGTDFTGYEPRAFVVRTEAAVADYLTRQKIYSENVIRLLSEIGSQPIF